MFNKRAGMFYRGIKATRRSRVAFRLDKTQLASLRPQKHSTKGMSLGSPNKGSNCEGNTLAYKKNKLCLISILYTKNINEECFLWV